MTKIVKAGLVVFIGSSVFAVGSSEFKLYDVKSGKIEYEIKQSVGTEVTFIKKRVIFDEYGACNLIEQNETIEHITKGQKETETYHRLTYMNNGMMYNVDLYERKIGRMKKDIQPFSESLTKKYGGKKTGTDKVLGYTCDVWELMGTKQCIYKRIPLRIEIDSNSRGQKHTEVATKAEFDISISKDDFKLPDFSVYDKYGKKLDKSKLDKMDAKENAK